MMKVRVGRSYVEDVKRYNFKKGRKTMQYRGCKNVYIMKCD